MGRSIILTSGWVVAATESIDCSPPQRYIKKLVAKAWEKPFKIIKFYDSIKARNTTNNTVIALKSLHLFHQYIIYGPNATIFPLQDNERPIHWISQIISSWEKIRSIKEKSTTDFQRCDLCVEAICEYSSCLLKKVEFIRSHINIFNGSLQLSAFYQNPTNVRLITRKLLVLR
jgi:hypothetical protein